MVTRSEDTAGVCTPSGVGDVGRPEPAGAWLVERFRLEEAPCVICVSVLDTEKDDWKKERIT